MAVVPKKEESAGRKDETLRVRLDAALKARLLAVCEQTGQKMSAAARFLLLAGLDAHEKEQKRK